jgi:hypothetical protein
MGNNSSSPFLLPVPIEYGPGIVKTFSVSGTPATYIQIDENNLKECLQYTNDQNTINNCISNNIYTPSVNGAISNINLWSGKQLPPNPACNFIFHKNKSPTKEIVYAGAGPGMTLKNIKKNIENFENNLLTNNNVCLLVIIVIVLLIMFYK